MQITSFLLSFFRRKRGDKEINETPGEQIVRKLTIERLEELKKIITEEEIKYKSVLSFFLVLDKKKKNLCCFPLAKNNGISKLGRHSHWIFILQ